MKKRSSRHGMVMVAALIIISLIAVSAALCAQQHLQLRRQALREADARQAHWLAEGALSRALAAMKNDAAYQGETWQASLGDESGEAIIRVETLENNAGRQITIDARFPLDPLFGVKHELSYVLKANP
jgi:type II secretory pathway component PulK